MKRLITVNVTERGVINVDVSDEAARKMSFAGLHRTYSRESQVQATKNILNTLGLRVPAETGLVHGMHIRGKRGINNSGWTAIVWPETPRS